MFKTVLSLLILSLGGANPVYADADGIWFGESEAAQSFIESVRQKGLPAFHGTWKIVENEGLDCASEIRISSSEKNQLIIAAVGELKRPDFRMDGINQGDLEETTLTEYLWSRTLWEGTRLYQRQTIRGGLMGVKFRADRDMELFADGSLAIRSSESSYRENEHYRCVYQR